MITGIVLADTDLSKYVTFQKLFEITKVTSLNSQIFLLSSQMMGFSGMKVVCDLLDSNDDTIGSATVSRPMTRFIKFLPVFNRPVPLERNKTYSIEIAVNPRANFLLGAALWTLFNF